MSKTDKEFLLCLTYALVEAIRAHAVVVNEFTAPERGVVDEFQDAKEYLVDAGHIAEDPGE
ncbi:MAG: hypothetical protein GY725_22925 [bacterium]|nr:hypothetical protein [bacterium]